jgi:multicomponent Na+:H+ antiporter subunit G
MSIVIDTLSSALFIVGGALAVIAAIGLHRLGGTRSRMHAATKPATLGVLCCAIGAALQLDSVSVATKLLVAVCLQLVTAPVGAHMLSRSVTRRAEQPPRSTS